MPEEINLLSLKPGEKVWAPVLSGSMAPGFLPGDEVEILILDRTEINTAVVPGMIAVFYEDGVIYFHRVLLTNIFTGKVYQKGDSNPAGSWISADRVIGRIISGRRSSSEGLIEYNNRRWSAGKAGRYFVKTEIMKALRHIKTIIKRVIKGV